MPLFARRRSGSGSGSGLKPQLTNRSFFTGVNLGVLRKTHDLERFLDDWREATEADLPALFNNFLDDLDQDADPDGIDNLGLAEIEKETSHAIIDELVSPCGNLLSSDIIDIAASVENGPVGFPLNRNFELFRHHDGSLSVLTIRIVVPPGPLEISTSSMWAFMIASPQPRF